MRTRKAILPDAKHIYDLIASYSGDGTLLPRTLAEICENVRDFVVLEHEGRIFMARISLRFARSR
jgi:amino-acid N-acetyltransferase